MTDFEIGSIIDGRYEIVGVLGSGGMGRVYKARQLNLNRIVAIKVPSEAVLRNEDFLARFVREGSTCARVAHGHIVSIYDVHSGRRPYIVMEYVDGMPLNQFLQEEQTTLFVADLLEIIGQVCQGLEAAHASGVIHRDIKPANIVITRDDHRVKVMDFGIARVSDNTALTTGGSMMGTPFYMAPEQIKGEEVGPPTDLYALACLVYHLFTGKLVFDGEVATLIYKHVSAKPIPPCTLNSMLPKPLDAVLLRGLSKEPRERYSSALEFHRELCKAMRPISQLPYSQIFARPMPAAQPSEHHKVPGKTLASQRTLTSDPKLQPTAPSRDRPKTGPKSIEHADTQEKVDLEGKTTALKPDSTESPAAEPPALPVPLVSAPSTPGPAPAPAPTAPPHTSEQAPVRRRETLWLLAGACVLVVAAGLMAVVTFWPGKNASITPPPPPPPTPTLFAPVVERTLVWLPSKDAISGVYEAGDYVQAWWCPESTREPAPLPASYRVSLTGASTRAVWKTLEQKLAILLEKPGSYVLKVEALDAKDRQMGSLEADLTVRAPRKP